MALTGNAVGRQSEDKHPNLTTLEPDPAGRNMAEAGFQVVIEDDRVIDTEAALNACGQEWNFMLELMDYALEEKEDNILKLRQCLQRKWLMTVCSVPSPPLSLSNPLPTDLCPSRPLGLPLLSFPVFL